MKRISTLVLILLFSIKALAQHDKTESLQQSSLKKASQEATIIFEGKVVKQNKSFWGTGDNSNSIYTSYTLEVKEVLFGDIKSGTIEIIVAGGISYRNVKDIINLKPYGIDINSCIEKYPGKKDFKKMSELIKIIRG